MPTLLMGLGIALFVLFSYTVLVLQPKWYPNHRGRLIGLGLWETLLFVAAMSCVGLSATMIATSLGYGGG